MPGFSPSFGKKLIAAINTANNKIMQKNIDADLFPV